jgi:hypothetical protein
LIFLSWHRISFYLPLRKSNLMFSPQKDDGRQVTKHDRSRPRPSITQRIPFKMLIDPGFVVWRSGCAMNWVAILIWSFIFHYLITNRIRTRITGNQRASQNSNFLTGL